MNDSTSEPIGLIAGWGSFPLEVAQRIRAGGNELAVVALKGHADDGIRSLATHFRAMGVLKVGAHLRFFSRLRVNKVVWAGKIFKHRILYQGRGWIEHVPDVTCLRVLGASFVTHSRDGRDDTVLQAIVHEYERRGFQVMPITQVAPGLLVEEGCLTRRRPPRGSLLDAQFGMHIAKSMGGLDIGQSITVKDQIVLGVEAIEGTDALIARTARLCPRGGFTLVKVAKPKQDMRFDVPTIGRRTVEQMLRAGGKTIVVEAGRTIFVDRDETLQLANQQGVSIISLNFGAASNSLPSVSAEDQVVARTLPIGATRAPKAA